MGSAAIPRRVPATATDLPVGLPHGDSHNALEPGHRAHPSLLQSAVQGNVCNLTANPFYALSDRVSCSLCQPKDNGSRTQHPSPQNPSRITSCHTRPPQTMAQTRYSTALGASSSSRRLHHFLTSSPARGKVSWTRTRHQSTRSQTSSARLKLTPTPPPRSSRDPLVSCAPLPWFTQLCPRRPSRRGGSAPHPPARRPRPSSNSSKLLSTSSYLASRRKSTLRRPTSSPRLARRPRRCLARTKAATGSRSGSAPSTTSTAL